MNNLKLILIILYLVGITTLFVGCNQASVLQEAAEITGVNPTKTSLPPSPTEIPPTTTQIPPTETAIPPTETPTIEPTKVLTEVEFVEADLLGTWVLEARPDTGMKIDANGLVEYFEKEGPGGVGTYVLNGDVVTFTDYDCVKIVGGIAQEYTCSADYKVTFFMDDDDQAYFTLELIGEDEHSYRKLVLFNSFWLQVE